MSADPIAAAGSVSSGSPGQKVVYERLRLRGFGLHRDLVARFPPALGVWAAPNEDGKTTAALGLAATLWGTPHRSDPAVAGWARYRSWRGGPHRGELTLVARDGLRYTVEREFDTHRVRLTRHEGGLDEVIIDTHHNPAARLGISPFERWLRDSLGVVEADLVLATAVLAQGDLAGEPHRLGQDVQRLLSGAGGGGAQAALERLAEGLRERTRWLRTLDLGLADLRQPRSLERLEAEAEELRRRAEAGRTAAEGLQAARARLAEAEAEHARAASESRRASAAVEVRHAWLEARDRLRRATERLSAEQQRLERALELTRERAAAESELRALTGARLPPEHAEREVSELRAAEAAAASARQRERAAEAELAAHPEFVAHTQPAAHAQPAADTRPETRREPAAAELARARQSARTLRRRIDAARSLRERLTEDAAALERVAVFDRLPDEVLDLASGFGQREQALVERVQSARSRRDDLLERVQRHRAAFAGVRELTPDQVHALEALDGALERRRDPRPWRIAAAVAGALAGGWAVPQVLALLGLVVPHAMWWAGAAGGLVGVLLPIGDGTARARRLVAEAGLSGDDDELRQRLRQRSAFDAQYEQVQSDAAALERAEQQLEACESEGRDFLRAVEPVLSALPEGSDVEAAYLDWMRLKPLVRAARSELSALLGDLVDDDAGLDPERFEEAPVRAGDGPLVDLVRLMALVTRAEASPTGYTLGAVARWLDGLSDETWEAWETDAARADDERLARERQEATEEAERARQRVWREALAAMAAAATREREETESRLVRAKAAVGAWWNPTGAHGDGEAPASELLIGEEETDDYGRLEQHSPVVRSAESGEVSSPGVPAAARASDWLADVREAQRRLAQAERDLGSHLRSCRARSVEEMRARTQGLEGEVEGAAADWRAIVSQHPDLPPVDLEHVGADGEGLEELERMDAVSRSFARVEALAGVAAEREREAHAELLSAQRDVAAAEGASTVNAAALMEASREKAALATAVREEVEAMALAHAELAASWRSYTADHGARLEESAGGFLAAFSDRPRRRVTLDEAFAASVIEPEGDVALPAQLSQGTRDQLALSLRLAVLDLVSGDVPLPLVLDDPFVHWDEVRSGRAREMLRRLARERQVILLTHRSELSGWGEPVVREGDMSVS